MLHSRPPGYSDLFEWKKNLKSNNKLSTVSLQTEFMVQLWPNKLTEVVKVQGNNAAKHS